MHSKKITAMDDYKDIRERLALRHDIKASAELRERIAATMERKATRRIRMRVFYGVSTACAVAVLLFVLFFPAGMSARKLLASALDAMRDCGSFAMEVEVRTRPMENFAFIDLEAPFVAHRISVEKADTLTRWRVDKGGRVSCGTASESNTWIPRLNIGWHDRQRGENVLDFIRIFLSPDRILSSELGQVMADDGAEYKVRRVGKELLLTVHSYPKGDFSNPYMLNRSIAESENIRRYTFDADTKRLKAASVEIVYKGHATEVLRLNAIHYGVVIPDIAKLPANVKFVEAEDLYGERGGFASLSPKEVAIVVLGAFENWDNKIIDRVIDPSSGDALYKEYYKGARLISVGEPFRSGNNENVYVPYTMRLPNGDIKRHNVVFVQKTDGNWLLVGGL